MTLSAGKITAHRLCIETEGFIDAHWSKTKYFTDPDYPYDAERKYWCSTDFCNDADRTCTFFRVWGLVTSLNEETLHRQREFRSLQAFCLSVESSVFTAET